MFPRFAANGLKTALADTPVVFLMGPRQCGKTTLVKSLLDDTWKYITPAKAGIHDFGQPASR